MITKEAAYKKLSELVTRFDEQFGFMNPADL